MEKEKIDNWQNLFSYLLDEGYSLKGHSTSVNVINEQGDVVTTFDSCEDADSSEIEELLERIGNFTPKKDDSPALKAEHQLFVDELFKNNMNQVKAYMAVYSNSSYDAARANASRLIANDNIQNLVELKFAELQNRNKISVDEIISDLKKIVEDCKVDNDRKNILKALDQLSKLIGAYAPQKIEHTNAPIHVNIIAPSQVKIQPGNDADL